MIKQRKLPYAATTIEPERTMVEIGKMLREFGIEDYQWTTLWGEERVELRFGIRSKTGERVMVRMEPPSLKTKKRVYDEKLARTIAKEIPSWPQAMRLLRHYLKSKLEAVAFGLRTFNEEFLADILVYGPSGEETTIAEVLVPRLEAGGYRTAALIAGKETEK